MGKKFMRVYVNQWMGIEAAPVIPAMWGGTNRRNLAQAG
jgi:hypothetical protein